MPTYYAHISHRGPIRDNMVPGPIGVHGTSAGAMPVGVASAYGRDRDGLSLWRLTIPGGELPGSWIIVDKRFRPAP